MEVPAKMLFFHAFCFALADITSEIKTFWLQGKLYTTLTGFDRIRRSLIQVMTLLYCVIRKSRKFWCDQAQIYTNTCMYISVNTFPLSKCNLKTRWHAVIHMRAFTQEVSSCFWNRLWPMGFASLPARLAVDTFRDRVLQEQSSGPASTANYHQSRGLIKVWLSSECSWGYAERGIGRGIGRGPTQDHTVSVRGRRCEIGLLAVINLWP